MERLQIRIDPRRKEQILARAAKDKRTLQAEVDVLIEAGLAVMEDRDTILRGASQLDVKALRGLARKEASA